MTFNPTTTVVATWPNILNEIAPVNSDQCKLIFELAFAEFLSKKDKTMKELALFKQFHEKLYINGWTGELLRQFFREVIKVC